MKVELELTPEEEAVLARKASERGLGIVDYLRSTAGLSVGADADDDTLTDEEMCQVIAAAKDFGTGQAVSHTEVRRQVRARIQDRGTA